MREKLKNLKSKKVVLAVGILLAVVIGATLAYFSISDSFTNEFQAGHYANETTEVFTSPDNWLPGDTTPKEISVKNTGNICEHVRIKAAEEWKDSNGNSLPLVQNGSRAAILNLDNTTDWVKFGNYYYYNKDLEENESTSSFLESVTFNENIANSYNCTTNLAGERECNSTGTGYDDATYTLTLHIETVQCLMSEDVWNVNVKNINTDHTRLDTGTIVNAKWKTLAAGGTSTTYSAQDTTITQIKRTGTLPTSISEAVSTTANKGDSAKVAPLNNSYEVKPLATEGTDYAIISTSTSTIPIYSWYDNGVIYYYSEAGIIELNPNSSFLFSNLRKLTSIGNFENEDASTALFMSSMFNYAGYNASSFNIDLSSWDISNVTHIDGMFSNAGYSATTWSIGDISAWDTSSVIFMSSTFENAGYSASSWTLGSLASWNTSNVTTMVSTFHNAGHDATSWSIGLINGWDTSKVTNMAGAFDSAGYSASSWNIGSLSSWNTSRVTDMNCLFAQAGHAASSFTLDLTNWDTSSVTDISNILYSAGYSAQTWNVGNLSSWNTSSVTSMHSSFNNAAYTANSVNIDVSGWDVSNVEDMQYMFEEFGHDATTWSIGDLSSWNPAKVETMDAMFWGAGYSTTNFNLGSLANWNTSSVTTMHLMFANAGRNATTWNIGSISAWDVSNVTSMTTMFDYAAYNASSFNIGSLSSWNTSKVTQMIRMFRYTGYNATNWQSIGTLKVYATNISDMFYGCRYAKATLNIYNKPTTITTAFASASTASGALITVNYASAVTNIDNIIATKSSSSNVVKGSVIS